jgi:hypothetical protein
MGAITAKKLSSAYFDNFSTGQLEFFATRPGSNSDVEIVFREPNMTISTGVGIGYTSAPQVRGRLTVLEKIGINNSTPTVALDVIGAGLFTSNITANSFIKSGGTSSQFLKADGSVDANAYITGTGTINYLPKFTGTSTLGSSGLFRDASRFSVNEGTDGSFGWDFMQNTSNPFIGNNVKASATYERVERMASTTLFNPAAIIFGYQRTNNGTGSVSYGGINFMTTSGNLAGDINPITYSRIFIEPDGNIGIGTMQPSYKFDIRGTLGVTGAATFSSSATANSFVKSGGTSSQFLKADGSVDSNTYLTTSSAASTYLPLAGGTLTGALNGTTGIFTTRLGVGGIGAASVTSLFTSGAGDQEIHFTHSDNIPGRKVSLRLTNANSVFYTYGGLIYAEQGEGLDQYGRMTLGINTTEIMHLTRFSRVGIMNNSPSYTLDVSGTFNATGNSLIGGTLGVASDSTLSGDLILRTSGGSRFQTAIRHYYEQQSRYAGEIQFLPEGSSGSALSFITNPSGGGQTERLRITQAGNIGIGTASPSYTLDVNGTFNATSNSLIGGTLGVTGLATLSGDLYNTGNEYFYDNSPNYGLAVKYKVINVYAQSGSQNTSFGFIKQQLVINNAQIYETSDSNYMSLTILNQSDLSVVSTTHYVTYNNATNINSLATAMNNMTISQIGIITTMNGWDFWTFTPSNGDTLRAAALNAGLTKLGSSYFHTGGAGSGYMRRYVAVFYGGGGVANVRNRNVIEVLESQSTSARPQAYLYCKIITNGQFASILGSTSTNALYSAEGGYDANIALSANRYGQIGIGTTNPAYQLELSTDSAAKPTTSTWTISSDIRLKENIETADLDRCYDIVNQLPLKRYRWKDDIYGSNQIKDRSKLGWIAQDVESIFPKAVGITPFKYNRYNTTTKPVLDLDGSNIYDENGNIVYETIKEIISEETIEDCKDLNVDQIYAVMYGTIKKLINIVEDNKTQIDMLKIEIDNLKSMN